MEVPDIDELIQIREVEGWTGHVTVTNGHYRKVTELELEQKINAYRKSLVGDDTL